MANPTSAVMDDSLNYDEPTMNFSFGNESTEDMQANLSSTLALRKNLSSAFDQSAVEVKLECKRGATKENSTTQNQNGLPGCPIEHKVVTELPTLAANSKGLSVFLRIRPSEYASTVKIISDKRVQTHPPISSQTHKSYRKDTEIAKEYDFARVMPDKSTQLEVYQTAAAPMVQGLVDRQRGIGHSGLLFSYGITNAGKTHTVLGNISQKKEGWGIVPRALSDILDRLPQNVQLSMSYFEVYNEQVFDLLPTEPSTNFASCLPEPLKVGERQGQIFIKDLRKHHVKTLQNGLDLIIRAKQRRVTASNNINIGSSRSHCVCQLRVHSCAEDIPQTNESGFNQGQRGGENEAHMWIVDLAGSERSKKTGVDVIRQKETANINKSLMTLMRCLSSLQNSHSKTIVPYRESKLTMLFMSHLTSAAAANTAMIVNIHPGMDEYDETQHVLQYAAVSRSITVSNLQQVSKPQTSNTQLDCEYGYDGRKKANVANRVLGVLKKLSPKRVTNNRKRKNCALPRPEATTENGSKKIKSDPATRRVPPISSTSKETSTFNQIHALEAQLAAANSEISSLRGRKDEYENDLRVAESQIRLEVAEEMDGHMKQMRRQYEETIKNLQQKLRQQQFPSSAPARSFDGENGKLKELTESIRECEDEMNRMREDHYLEMASLRTEHEKIVAAKDNDLVILSQTKERIAVLETDLENNRKEISALRQKLQTSHSRVAELETQLDEFVKVNGVGEGSVINKALALKDTESSVMGDASSDDDMGKNINKDTEESDCDSSSTPSRNDDSEYAKENQRPPKDMSVSHFIGLVKNNRGTSSDQSDGSFGPTRWLQPKNKVKRNPKSGFYQRPRGRAPTGARGWDEEKGAWLV